MFQCLAFVLCLPCLLPSVTYALSSHQAELQVELTYITEEGEGLPVDWKHQLRWIWRPTVFEDRDVESPYAQLWIALPEQFSDMAVSQASVWIKANSKESPFAHNESVSRVLVIETQTPIRTIPLTFKRADGRLQKAALRVRFLGGRSSLLRHRECDGADPHLVQAGEVGAFFFLAQYCGYDLLGERLNLLWPSLDVAIYDQDPEGLKRLMAVPLSLEEASSVQLTNLASSESYFVNFQVDAQASELRRREKPGRAKQWAASKPSTATQIDLSLFASSEQLEGWIDLTRGVLSRSGQWRMGLLTTLHGYDFCCRFDARLYSGYELQIQKGAHSLITGGLGGSYTHIRSATEAYDLLGLSGWVRLDLSRPALFLKNIELRHLNGVNSSLEVLSSDTYLILGFDAHRSRRGEIEIIGGIKNTNSKISSIHSHSILLGARIVR